MQRGNGAESGGAGIREGRMAESGAELEGKWAGGGDGEGQRVAGRAGARKNIFQEGGETIDIGGGLLYYTDGLGCFPGCFCYENTVRLNDAGLFLL